MEQSTGKNFFVKYWNGEIPLWISFWFINILINFFFNFSIVYFKDELDLWDLFLSYWFLPWGFFMAPINILGRMIYIIYNKFIFVQWLFFIMWIWQTIGLWNSATNYQKVNNNKIWPIIVKLYIMIRLIVLIGYSQLML